MKLYKAPLNEQALQELSQGLQAGATVLIPTDTVYGIAAAPASSEALKRIIAAKGRDPNKPCQLLAASIEAIRSAGFSLSPKAEELARKFWPGALTMVLHADKDFSYTEGFRIPDNALTREICAAAGGLLRCTSANLSGEKPAATAASAAAAIPSADILIEDTSAAPSQTNGLASSVIEVLPESGEIKVLREEAIPKEQLLG